MTTVAARGPSRQRRKLLRLAASEADCRARWDKADVSRSGTLEGKAATAYLDAITKSGKKYDMKAVDKLSAAEFMAACKDDAFKTI